MALTDFKPQFDNAYQEIFQKVLVAKKVASFRFEPILTYGESLERVAYDIDSVVVRATSRGSASTIDSVTDSAELLLVNLEYEAAFHISDGEVKQAGPLNPGEVIGGKIAHKVAQHFDGLLFAEVLNAAFAFDTGDLTTLASNGTGITLSGTTVPQIVSRAPAKLQSKNQVLSNMVMVIDSYTASAFEEYLMGKDWNLAEATYKNGYAGTTGRAEVYISENLTSTAVLTYAGVNVNTKYVSINGIALTSVTSIGTTAGNVLVAASVTLAGDYVAGIINDPGTTSATQVALSTANQATFKALGLSAVNVAGVVTVTAKGGGTLTLAEDETNAAWTLNTLHCYFGKKGGIDAVLQDMKDVDMRPTADRRGTNVFSSYLGGIKTFTDGSKKFLDLKIAK